MSSVYSLNVQFTSYREAKGIHQSLKEALKDHDAWDREVEFQRKRHVQFLVFDESSY
jgi:hypothetical protein